MPACKSGCWNPVVNSPRSHCSTCHDTFAKVSQFDEHRVNGKCVYPGDLDIGLVLQGGIWDTEEGHQKTSAFVERVKKGKQS